MKIYCCLLLTVLLAGHATAKTPDSVKVGAYVISLHDINFHEKEYTSRFWLWFLYSGSRFDFSKQLDIPNAKTIDQPQIITDTLGGKNWVIMKMKAVMKENWSVIDFPFDRQHLKIQIENTLFDNSDLVFEPDIKGSHFAKNETIDGWRISNFHVSVTNSEYETGFGDSRPGKDPQFFSAFLIEMDIERNGFGLFMKIFVGMYISFLIALVSFAPHPTELEPRFGLPVGGLFAAVGNKYIIDSILPESSTFTLVDTLHTITFLGIFAILVVSAVCLVLHDKEKLGAVEKVDYWGARAVVFVYLIANALFITLALTSH
jgi:hypothetical protein